MTRPDSSGARPFPAAATRAARRRWTTLTVAAGLVTAGLVAAGLVAALTACGADPSLHWQGDERVGGDGGEFGMGEANARPGAVFAIGTIELCVDGATAATVDDVAFRTNDHVIIRRFGVRRLDYTKATGLGNEPGSIVAAGFRAEDTTARTACVHHRRDATTVVDELGLDVENGANTVSTGKTLVVSYHIGDRHARAEIPMQVKLCPGPDTCT